jgi:DNA polymerase III subunit gamma/tau
VLYQEVRPKKFSEVCGNLAILSSLKNIVSQKQNKRPHAFLFQGASGCGKTTIARILAREFGCNEVDLTELDAAKDRNVDAMRQLVADSQYSPIAGDCRVFIIDEVHELTKMAQETLLKTTEDTPETTYFMFCTTEPDKIINTIKNRCTIFQVQRLRDKEMEDLLNSTLEKLEKDIPSDEVFFRIVDCADGSPRKALVMLEQVLSVNNEKEQLKLIQQANIESEISDLVRTLFKAKEWKDVVKVYQSLPQTEPEQIRRSILSTLKYDLLNAKNNKTTIDIASVMKMFIPNVYDTGEAGLIYALHASWSFISEDSLPF